LLCFLRAKDIGLKDATYAVCDTFIDSLVQLAASSKRFVWSILSSFFKYLQRVDVVGANPCAGGCPVQSEQPSSRHLEKLQVETLLEGAHRVSPRCYVTCKLLYGSGLRSAEMCNLRLDDVSDATGGRKKVTTVGKGRKKRTVTLNLEASGILERWAHVQERRGHTFVFQGRSPASGISTMTLHRMIKAAGKEANLRNVSAHWLRHAYASHCLDGGAKLHDVRESLGHEVRRF
jgi:integrase/recombinase XerD